jgi:cysteine synthase
VHWARAMAQTEGMMIGPTSGAAIKVAPPQMF